MQSKQKKSIGRWRGGEGKKEEKKKKKKKKKGKKGERVLRGKDNKEDGVCSNLHLGAVIGLSDRLRRSICMWCQHSNEREASVLVSEIHSIPNDELIGACETNIVHMDVGSAAAGLIQQAAQAD